MKTFEQLKEELINIESSLQSQVLGGTPNDPPYCVETPYPVGGTNCEKVFAQTYQGGELCGTDQGWSCEDHGSVA